VSIITGDDEDEVVQEARRMAKVYIAGPMTGYPEFNYPAFHDAAVRLRDRGFEVVSPAELNPIDAGLEINEQYYAVLYPSFLKRDIAALLECDHIYLLDGWEKSKGATLERHIATVLGIEQVELNGR
jgi:hypothetical protein